MIHLFAIIRISELLLNPYLLLLKIKFIPPFASVGGQKKALYPIATERILKYSSDMQQKILRSLCQSSARLDVLFESFIILHYRQMSKVTTSLLLIALLTLLARQEPATSDFGHGNFQGDFDSMAHIPISRSQPPQFSDEEDSQQELSEDDAEEERDMLEFSQHMADFLPDETFTFRMQPNGKEEFFVWPGAEVESIRGMFHAEVLDESMEGYVSLDLYDNDILVRNYKQQRLGIFNIPHNLKDHRYTFIFSASDALLEVYFSYEATTSQKRENFKEKNETDIQRITREFQKVNRLVIQQESQMSRLIGISSRHEQKFGDYLKSVVWTIFLETLVINIGTTVCLMLLKRQLYAGYSPLV